MHNIFIYVLNLLGNETKLIYVIFEDWSIKTNWLIILSYKCKVMNIYLVMAWMYISAFKIFASNSKLLHNANEFCIVRIILKKLLLFVTKQLEQCSILQFKKLFLMLNEDISGFQHLPNTWIKQFYFVDNIIIITL